MGYIYRVEKKRRDLEKRRIKAREKYQAKHGITNRIIRKQRFDDLRPQRTHTWVSANKLDTAGYEVGAPPSSCSTASAASCAASIV